MTTAPGPPDTPSQGPSAASDRRVIVLHGEYDRMSSPALETRLEGATGDRDPLLVLDMGGVTFLDSSTIHVLASLWKRLDARGGGLVIQNPSTIVQRVVRACGLERLLEQPAVPSEPGHRHARPVPHQ